MNDGIRDSIGRAAASGAIRSALPQSRSLSNDDFREIQRMMNEGASPGVVVRELGLAGDMQAVEDIERELSGLAPGSEAEYRDFLERVADEIEGHEHSRESAQSVETTFESGEESGLVRVMETENFKAEIKFLRQPDTGDPLGPNPWHAKVIGPVHSPGRGGWVIEPVWSGSFDNKSNASDAAKRQLKRHQERFENRQGRRDRSSPPEFPQVDGGSWTFRSDGKFRLRFDTDAPIDITSQDEQHDWMQYLDEEAFVAPGFLAEQKRRDGLVVEIPLGSVSKRTMETLTEAIEDRAGVNVVRWDVSTAR